MALSIPILLFLRGDKPKMKKLKILLCLALVFAMITSASMVSFAASVSHISYNETTEEGVTTVESSVFVAGQSKDMKLYTALYDAEDNFVKAVSSNAAKTGLLKTSVVKQAGQTVKSFVWDADNTPAYKTGKIEELTADDINNVNITINGKPVSDFGIESLELGGEYDVDYYKYSLDAIPYVKVTENDAALTTSVSVDEENMKTVVTIAKGANGKETVTKVIGGTYNIDTTRYSRASATITFNWVKTYITDEDFSRATTSSTTNGWIYEVPSELALRTNKTVTLAEGENVKKVSVKFAKFTNQQTVVVVKPAATAAENYRNDPKSIVVTSDGSALGWANDGNVIDDYNLLSEAKGYNATYIRAYGKKSNTNSATVGTTAVPVYYPVKAVMSNDNGYETGSRTTTERTPNTHQRQIYDLGKHTDLLGCAYIVGPNTALTDGVVTFYVADDAEISTLSPSTTVTYSVADGAYEAADSTSNDKCKIIYTNNASASDVAWLMKKGYIYPSDITATNSNANKKHVLNDGTTVSPTSYTLRTWDYVTNTRRVPAKVVPYNGYALVPEWSKQKNYTYQEMLDLWKDFEFDNSSTALVQNFNSVKAFSGTGTFRYPENLSDYNNEKYADIRQLHENYTFSNVSNSGNEAVLFKGGFPGKSAYIDRSGEDLAAGTGTIMQYPEAMGLEDDYYILPALNLVNGPRFGALGMASSGNIAKLSSADIWRQAPGIEWGSFTVTRDAKVTIMSDVNNRNFATDAADYDYVLLDDKDCLKALTTANNGATRTFRHVYTKHYPAGSKVTLTTSGGSLYVTFIDEWESDIEHSADLTGITIDGVALDGFDKDTTEYTYNVSVNADTAPVIAVTAKESSAKVKIVYPKEFPGSAKINVKNVDTYKTYTINFAVDSALSGNVVMSPSVKFAGKNAVLLNNLQVGDFCYGDRLTNVAMTFKSLSKEYVGADWLRGCLGWPNDPTTNDYKVKWQQADIISDWVSVDIYRDSTIHIVTDVYSSNAKAQYLLNNGWATENNADGFIVGYTNTNVKYHTRYMKHFEVDEATGKATVQVPNIGGTSMFVVIVHDDWK